MSTTTSATTDEAEGQVPQRILQRLIMPLSPTPDVIPLYLEAHAARSGAHTAAFGLGSAPLESHENSASAPAPAPASGRPQIDELSARFGLYVPEQSLRSFGTYFNAFPASYWRRWTPVREVTLSISTRGSGQIIVYRSNARGAIQRQDMVTVTSEGTSRFTLPLTAFGDGGWYWFDVITGEAPLTILGAEWTAAAADARTKAPSPSP